MGKRSQKKKQLNKTHAYGSHNIVIIVNLKVMAGEMVQWVKGTCQEAQ